MTGMKNVLQNKAVNNLTVAVILGFATINFVSTVVGPLVGNLFDSASAQTWAWNEFWTALVMYLVFWVVAGAVNSQAE